MDAHRPQQTPGGPARAASRPAPSKTELPARDPTARRNGEIAGDAKAAEGTRAERPSTAHLGSAASHREILMRGRRAFERGEDAEALDHLTRLTRHGLEYADVHYMIGVVQERRGEHAAALASLRRAIRINPSYVEALIALASLYEGRGDFDQSAGYAQRASQLSRPVDGGLDPTTRGKLANQQAALADALNEAGEQREAIEEYRRALDRCPTFHDVRHRLGVTLREAGLPFQAAQEFQRILRAHPRMLDSQIQLGLTYYAIGRTPEAIAEWDAVLQKDPSRDEARMYLRLVRGADRAASALQPEAAAADRAAGSARSEALASEPSQEPAGSPQARPVPGTGTVEAAAGTTEDGLPAFGKGPADLLLDTLEALDTLKAPDEADGLEEVPGWSKADLVSRAEDSES